MEDRLAGDNVIFDPRSSILFVSFVSSWSIFFFLDVVNDDIWSKFTVRECEPGELRIPF